MHVQSRRPGRIELTVYMPGFGRDGYDSSVRRVLLEISARNTQDVRVGGGGVFRERGTQQDASALCIAWPL